MNQKLTNILTPIVALFFAAALGVTAATTIGTDITTEGDLDVTGSSTLGLLTISGSTIDSAGDTVDLNIDNTGGGNILIEASGGGHVSMRSGVQLTMGAPSACGVSEEGIIAYSNNNGALCFCSGTDWFEVASDTVPCTFGDI